MWSCSTWVIADSDITVILSRMNTVSVWASLALIGRRCLRLEARRGCSGRGDRAVVVRGRDRVVRWRSVLEERFSIHIRSEASCPLQKTNIKSSWASSTRTITGLTQTKTKTKIRVKFLHSPHATSARSYCFGTGMVLRRINVLKMRHNDLVLISLVYERNLDLLKSETPYQTQNDVFPARCTVTRLTVTWSTGTRWRGVGDVLKLHTHVKKKYQIHKLYRTVTLFQFTIVYHEMKTT